MRLGSGKIIVKKMVNLVKEKKSENMFERLKEYRGVRAIQNSKY